MIFIIGITISFFLEFLLLSKKGKDKADKILAVWMFFIGLHLFLFYLFFSGLYLKYPSTAGIIMPLPLIHGPLLYLYVGTLSNQLPERKIFRLIHFAPVLIMYVYLIHFLMLPAAEKIRIMQSGGKGYEVFNRIKLILFILSGVFYVAASQILLFRHRKNIRKEFSAIEKINLAWLQYLILGISFIWIVVISVGVFLSDYFKLKNVDSDIFVFTAVVIFVCFLGFFGLRQTHIFTPRIIQLNHSQDEQPSTLIEKKEYEKYAKSGLKDTDAEQLHKKLNEYMRMEKPYLDSEISLTKLGESFGVHSNYLSQVINDRESKNFYDYINGYRIDEFKQMVSDPKNQKLTIMALALECGFNSKSAFNNCFKKLTNQTPSEYMKRVNGVPKASLRELVNGDW
jgi:AraC-like DNA-binding protein